MQPPFATKQLSGWGRFPMQLCHAFRPEKQSEVADILASRSQSSYISRGLGRSYGDAALNSDAGVIDHLLLNRFLSFQASTGILECEAGVSLAEITQHFLPHGWFLPVTPGTKFVTVGGAIAADVHGKNHHKEGSFSNFVLDLQLLLPGGETLICSPSSHADVFWATTGGMGLTGTILSARLQLRPVESAYVWVDYHKATNLEDALGKMDESDERYQYSVAWIDVLAADKAMGRSVLMRGNHAPAADLPRRITHPLDFVTGPRWNLWLDFPSGTLNGLTVKAFNAFYYGLARTRSRQLVNFEKFFYPLDAILHWNRMYGRRGFVQYQIALPPPGAREGLRLVLARLARSGRASFLAVLKRFGDSSPGLLSFPTRGYTLALDIPAAPGIVPFLHELDRITLDHGGRVYLAKDSVVQAADFAAMYPKLAEFQEVQKRIDPQGRMSSSQARRLRIVG